MSWNQKNKLVDRIPGLHAPTGVVVVGEIIIEDWEGDQEAKWRDNIHMIGSSWESQIEETNIVNHGHLGQKQNRGQRISCHDGEEKTQVVI